MKRFKGVWIAATIAALLTAGCAVNQKREVATYRKVLDAGQPKMTSAFKASAPLSLKQALAVATADNEELAISGEDYLQALIDKNRAFARFLPTISFVPEYMRQEKTALASFNPLVKSFVPEQSLDAPVEGQETLSPFTDVPALGAAASAADIRKAQLLERRAVVLLDVCQTYYQVLRAEAENKVLAHSVAVQTRQVADMRAKYAAGVVRPLDVAQAEARLSETRTARIQAQRDIKNGRAMLALLMGVPKVTGPLTDGFNPPQGDWTLRALYRQAAAHRQDLAAARALVAAAAAHLRSAWGEYFPSVSLNLTRYLRRDSFPNDVDWTAMIGARIPIFSAGLAHADVRTAYSQLRQANLAASLVRKQILKDLRTARENLATTDQRIHELGIQKAAAREIVRQTDAGYDSGLATKLSRMRAANDLLNAQLAETSARYDRNVDYLRLLRAAGCLDATLALPPATAGQTDQPAPGAAVSP